MKFILSFVFVFINLFAFSQELNSLGKINVSEIPTMPDHKIEKIGEEYKIFTDSFTFEGNTYYKVPDGYITSLEVFDNDKDFIKQYDLNGKLLATILSDRIINLKVSKNGKKIAFYNEGNIIHINLNNYKLDTLTGSFVFEFLEDNELIYYDSENKAIWFKGTKIEIAEYPNQFVEFKNKIYIITKANIFELVGNSLFSKYSFKGKFFDSRIVDDVFYFVDKEEKRKKESFTMYKTSDFINFQIADKLSDLNR